jgi:hypothetical protein
MSAVNAPFLLGAFYLADPFQIIHSRYTEPDVTAILFGNPSKRGLLILFCKSHYVNMLRE